MRSTNQQETHETTLNPTSPALLKPIPLPCGPRSLPVNALFLNRQSATRLRRFARACETDRLPQPASSLRGSTIPFPPPSAPQPQPRKNLGLVPARFPAPIPPSPRHIQFLQTDPAWLLQCRPTPTLRNRDLHQPSMSQGPPPGEYCQSSQTNLAPALHPPTKVCLRADPQASVPAL